MASAGRGYRDGLTGGGCNSGSRPTWPPDPSSSPPGDVPIGGISWSWLLRCFMGTRSSVRLSRCAHVEVRALLQFHAGGTKNNRRHRHRKSCLGFNGEPHGFVALFFILSPKITPTWLFPPKPSRIGTQPIGAGLLAQYSVIPFYGHNLASLRKKKR